MVPIPLLEDLKGKFYQWQSIDSTKIWKHDKTISSTFKFLDVSLKQSLETVDSSFILELQVATIQRLFKYYFRMYFSQIRNKVLIFHRSDETQRRIFMISH